MSDMAAGVAAPFEFVLSGFTELRSKRYILKKIRALGGRANNSSTYDVRKCTHVISYKPFSSDLFIRGVASGKWILKPEFITDSFTKGKWQAEYMYEWSEGDVSENVEPGLLTAPRRWREKIAASGHGAFHDWKVLLHVNHHKNFYRRVLEAGGGQCVPKTFPIKEPAGLVSLVTHVIVEECYEKDIQCLKERGILCLPPEFIKEHLFQENPNMTQFHESNMLLTPPEAIRQRNIVVPTVKAKEDHDTLQNRKQNNPSGRESDTPVSMVILAEEGTSSDPGSSVKRKLDLDSLRKPEPPQISKKRKPMEFQLNLIPPPKPQTETSMYLMQKYGIEEFEMEYTESDYDELINYKLYTDIMRPVVLENAPKLHSQKLVNLLAALWKEFVASNPKKKKPVSTPVLDFKPAADEAKEAEAEEEEDNGKDDDEAKRESLEVDVKVQEEEKEEEVKEKKGGKDASTSKAVYVRRSQRQQSNTRKDEVSGGSIADHAPKSLPKKNNVNRRNHNGETPLQVACIKNDITKVRELLNKPDIDVNNRDNAGWTPLHEACIRGHTASVKELLKFTSGKRMVTSTESRGMETLDFLAAPSECGNTPLHDAVFNNHIEVVKLLVEAGGSILLTAKNKAGFTPFGMALTEVMKEAMLGQRSEVSRLPDVDEENENRGSLMNCENNAGSTPVNVAEREEEGIPGQRSEVNRLPAIDENNESRISDSCIMSKASGKHKCSQCPYSTSRRHDLQRHISRKHGKGQSHGRESSPERTTPNHTAVQGIITPVPRNAEKENGQQKALLVDSSLNEQMSEGGSLQTFENNAGFTPVNLAEREEEGILGQRSEVNKLPAIDEKNENRISDSCIMSQASGKHKCSQCSYSSKRRYDLKKHFSRKHGKGQSYGRESLPERTTPSHTAVQSIITPVPGNAEKENGQQKALLVDSSLNEQMPEGGSLLTCENNAGFTPVNVAEREAEGILGQRSEVNRLPAVDEENENRGSLLTCENNAGITPVNVAEREEEGILDQRSEVSRLPAVDEENENWGSLQTCENNAGSTLVNVAEREEEGILGQRSEVSSLPAVDEENVNWGSLPTCENNTGSTQVNMAEREEEGILGQRSEVSRSPAYDEKNENRGSLLTCENNTGFTPDSVAEREEEGILGQRSEVNKLPAIDKENENRTISRSTQTEVMKTPILGQRSEVNRLPAVDEENKNRRIPLAGVRNKAGLTPVDIAQTEVMKEANLGQRSEVSTLSAVSEENENNASTSKAPNVRRSPRGVKGGSKLDSNTTVKDRSRETLLSSKPNLGKDEAMGKLPSEKNDAPVTPIFDSMDELLLYVAKLVPMDQLYELGTALKVGYAQIEFYRLQNDRGLTIYEGTLKMLHIWHSKQKDNNIQGLSAILEKIGLNRLSESLKLNTI